MDLLSSSDVSSNIVITHEEKKILVDIMEVKVCPRCNSQDVSSCALYKFEQRSGLFKDECKNCGFIGTMILMKKEDADKLDVLKPEDFKT